MYQTSNALEDLGIATTVVDAALALVNGRRWSAALLLAAAVLSRWVPGLGVAVSVILRLARRLR